MAGGAPLKLTPELAAAVLADVRQGLFLTQVGINNNLHPNTIRTWVRRGLKPDAEEPFRSFAEQFLKAEVRVEKRWIDTIEKASEPFAATKKHTKLIEATGGGGNDESGGGPFSKLEEMEGKQEHRGDWKAAAFLLERRFPKRWGQQAMETSQRDALNVTELLEEAEGRAQDLDDLLGEAMPPELEEALLRHKDRLLELLQKGKDAEKPLPSG